MTLRSSPLEEDPGSSEEGGSVRGLSVGRYPTPAGGCHLGEVPRRRTLDEDESGCDDEDHPAWRRVVKGRKEDSEGFLMRYRYWVVIELVIEAIKVTFGRGIRSRNRHHKDVEVVCQLALWN